MNKLLMLTMILLLTLPSCVSDRGGSVNNMARYIATAPPREITGELDSSATLWLTNAACISPNAKFGFHEIRVFDTPQGYIRDYDHSYRSDAMTKRFIARLPVCVQNIIQRDNAMGSGRLMFYSGRDILNACHQIQSCGS